MAILLAVAFIAGGGGVGSPLANLVVQLTAVAVMATRYSAFLSFWRDSPMALRMLIAATLFLPLIQIIPLPETLWTASPAGPMVQSSLEQIDAGGWMPLSLDPRRTLLALTALITPLAVLWAGWTLPRERLIDLGWVTVGLGLATTLLGVFQLASTTEVTMFHVSRPPGELVLGTFANRNSTALFLGLTLGLAALLPAPRPHPAMLPLRLGLCLVLLVTIALTQSRSGMVLALLPVLLGTARALSAIAKRHAAPTKLRPALIGLGALALVGVGVGALVLSSPGRIGDALARFEKMDQARVYTWEDAAYSAGRYWPVGTGMGTFEDISQVDESLENLTLRRAGRAHNDYIELTIEAGAAGLALAVAWLALIAWLSWRARTTRDRWIAWGGGIFLAMIALQSITDFPLRNQTVLAFAGFALLLLTRFAAERRRAST